MVRSLPAGVVLAVALLAVVSVALPTLPSSGAAIPAPSGPMRPLIALPSTTPIRVAPGYVAPSGVSLVGPLARTAPLDVVVGLAPRDPGGLAARVAAESLPGTPAYRSHLSAPEAVARFGAPAESVRAASAYFETYGLNVTSAPDGLLLYLRGSSAAIGRSFGTTFDEYRSATGRTFVDHPTPAVLPAIAPWSGAFGLGNSTAFVPVATRSTSLSSAVPASLCSSSAGELSPCEVQTAYSVRPLLANGTNGSGVRLAVVDAYSSGQTETQLTSDLGAFASATGLSVGNVSYLYPDRTTRDLNSSGTNPGWALEDALDLEWTRAMAPAASIEMTFSPDPGPGLYAAIDWLVGGGRTDVISLSWGEPDVGVFGPFNSTCSSACNASTDGSYAILGPVLALAAVEGISVFAASGDCGSSGGTGGVSTFFPASDPYVTGVGGTDLSVSSSGTYLSESGWSGNSSGNAPPGCYYNSGGSGGGFAPIPAPWWQVGPGFSGTGRGVPDVAADAGTPVVVYTNAGATGVEGTSVATPIWAGIGADADQYARSDLGFLNPSVYRILAGSNRSVDFHDIVSGSNGYDAGPGWDPVTGVGSPIVSYLVRDLARAFPASPTNLSTTVAASPSFGSVPLTTHLTVSATRGSGVYPLEGIYFGDGNASLVAGGSVQHTFPMPGVYDVQSFVFDSRGNEAASPPVAVVAGGGSELLVQLNASNATPSLGAPVHFSTVVHGGTGPYTYDFFFGDGASETNDSSPNAQHAYVASAVYCAEVVVRDNASPTNGGTSAPLPIEVGGATAPGCEAASPPIVVTANASAGVRDAPADYPSLFATSGGAPGSGLATTTTLGSSDPYVKACDCAIFRSSGTYRVSEWVNDTAGTLANASLNVTVEPPLDVSFAISASAGPAPLTVNFSSRVVGGGYDASAVATRWTFGNGVGGVGDAVQETYGVPGEYLAIGSLSDLGHGNASEGFLIDVEPSSGSVPLGATATISPAVNLSSGTTVDYSAEILGPPGETANATVLWDLGQGHSAYGRSTAETYYGPLSPSRRNVLDLNLTLQDSYLTSLVTIPLTLSGFFATEAGGSVPAADGLELSTSAAPTFGVAPFGVSASGSASGPGGARLEWRFGDGGNATGGTAVHTYRSPGGFTLEANATDPFNDRAVNEIAVTSNGAVGVTGGPSSDGGSPPFSVRFTVSAYGGKGPPYTYTWTLPNGTQSTGPDLNLTITALGTFTVTLNVTDRAGALYQRNWTLSVRPVPILSLAEIVALAAGAGVVAAVVGTGVWRKRPPPTP